MEKLFKNARKDTLVEHGKLDKAMQITSALSWIPLVGATVVVLVTLWWSFTGSIPETITASGAVVLPYETNTIYADEIGTVQQYAVSVGDKIAANQTVCWIQTSSGESRAVLSNQAGKVARMLVPEGGAVGEKESEDENGKKSILRLDPDQGDLNRQVVVCYIPYDKVGTLKPGMQAYVSLTALDKQVYGHMQARITNIDRYPATRENMERLHGSTLGLNVDDQIVPVTLELSPDQTTVSGYWWSNKKGKQLTVDNAAKCSVRVITKTVAPIEKLLTRIKEIWNGK